MPNGYKCCTTDIIYDLCSKSVYLADLFDTIAAIPGFTDDESELTMTASEPAKEHEQKSEPKIRLKLTLVA